MMSKELVVITGTLCPPEKEEEETQLKALLIFFSENKRSFLIRRVLQREKWALDDVYLFSLGIDFIKYFIITSIVPAFIEKQQNE